MKRYMKILAFCMLFMAFFLSGCSLSPKNTGVLIGANLALSGKGMSYSTSTERGIELAKDMVNERGGLLGKPVQIVSDNHGKLEDAVAAIQQLTVRHVSAIIGPDLTDCTRAVLSNVEAVKIPLISPACTQPDITVDPKSHEVYRYIFRAAYIDASQGRAMADYALKQLHVKRAAVFYYPDKLYAQGLAEYFRSAFAASGGEVPVYIPVEDVQDLMQYLPLLQRENIDVIYLPGYDDWTIPAIELLRSRGISLPLLGPDGWNGLRSTIRTIMPATTRRMRPSAFPWLIMKSTENGRTAMPLSAMMPS